MKLNNLVGSLIRHGAERRVAECSKGAEPDREIMTYLEGIYVHLFDGYCSKRGMFS